MSLKLKRFMNKPNIALARLAVLSCPEITPDIELSNAIFYDDINMVIVSLNKGASIRHRFLHAVIRYINKLYTNDDIIKLLIEMDANVNIQEPYDKMRGALHYIVRSGDNNELLSLLIENGARIDIRDDYGNTPLHYCTNSSQGEILLN